jgi:hypothetical protein
MAEKKDRPNVPYPLAEVPEEFAYVLRMATLPFRDKLQWLADMGRMRRLLLQGPLPTEVLPEPCLVVENQ